MPGTGPGMTVVICFGPDVRPDEKGRPRGAPFEFEAKYASSYSIAAIIAALASFIAVAASFDPVRTLTSSTESASAAFGKRGSP